ncbi:endonuclease/exonuclease/phosphatase family protein [Massilia sp. TSP1-1-2]|uniref:endonuclease/exonuclease/phosphatase family protein n=1 Tax=Massilia sp. TSP1-1-2 TaxID=2804649 RepID=UPI003CEDBF03
MKLLSWNIQRGHGLRDTCSIARVVADLRHMADFDVLCLQEVSSGYTDLPGADGGNQFMQLARLLHGYTPLAGVATDTQGEGDARLLFGNMIFSRFPVVQVLRHALPWPADAAVMSMQRGAIEATLDTARGLLRVSTAHLEYFSLVQRAAQVERLRELHRDACLHAAATRPGDSDNGPFCAVPRAMPALLTGDFNFLPGSAEYLRLQDPYEDGVPAMRDAWRVRHPALTHAPTVCLHDERTVPFTSDFIFASADLAPRVRELRVMPGNFGPDHQPLLIELD